MPPDYPSIARLPPRPRRRAQPELFGAREPVLPHGRGIRLHNQTAPTLSLLPTPRCAFFRPPLTSRKDRTRRSPLVRPRSHTAADLRCQEPARSRCLMRHTDQLPLRLPALAQQHQCSPPLIPHNNFGMADPIPVAGVSRSSLVEATAWSLPCLGPLLLACSQCCFLVVQCIFNFLWTSWPAVC